MNRVFVQMAFVFLLTGCSSTLKQAADMLPDPKYRANALEFYSSPGCNPVTAYHEDADSRCVINTRKIPC